MNYRYYYAVEPTVAAVEALHAWPGEAQAAGTEPFMLSCRPPGARLPAAVSVVQAPCSQPTNLLNVQVPSG